MKKIIVFIMTALMVNFCNIPCSAETLLTYYDTVVIMPSADIVTKAEPDNNDDNKYEEIEKEKKGFSLKNIMVCASNTFFQR